LSSLTGINLKKSPRFLQVISTPRRTIELNLCFQELRVTGGDSRRRAVIGGFDAGGTYFSTGRIAARDAGIICHRSGGVALDCAAKLLILRRGAAKSNATSQEARGAAGTWDVENRQTARLERPRGHF